MDSCNFSGCDWNWDLMFCQVEGGNDDDELPSSPAPQLPSSTTPAPPQQSKLTAQATYAIDLATIYEGSNARRTFEADFKASVVSAMGGSTTADDVTINSIAAGSVVVDFHVTVPTATVSAATATFTTNIKNNPAALTVSGAAPAVTAPIVAAVPPPPPPPPPPVTVTAETDSLPSPFSYDYVFNGVCPSPSQLHLDLVFGSCQY